MTDKALFQPYKLGSLTLANRFVMAPLTRNRAGAGLVPSEFAATYYAQRASAGLIITEATQISPQAQGYQDTPGLYIQAQIDGWRKVTDAVHAKGGKIFVQLWHVGRISHVDLQPNGAAPVAPSAWRRHRSWRARSRAPHGAERSARRPCRAAGSAAPPPRRPRAHRAPGRRPRR